MGGPSEHRDAASRLRRRGAACFAVSALALAGCGGDESDGTGKPAGPDEPRAERDTTSERRELPLRIPRCPAAAANCERARGRIVYVEAVDPDGDGDAHFVLSSRQSVTAAGISVIDVKKELRPDPLPRVGDELSAAGPVYRGSYGQRQIEATAIRVRR